MIFILYTEQKVEALKNNIAENQWHYINLFLVGCIKDHGTLVNTSKELFEVMKKEKF